MQFEVRTLQISGNSVFDTDTLLGLVADARGKRLSLRQLETLIGRITAHYRTAGYPLARAIIPAQTIVDGGVRVEVIEARLGAVRLDNRSVVMTDRLESILAPLRAGEVIAQASLDRPLLLISDLSGVIPSAVIRAGSVVGTSDLDVRVEPGAAWAGRAQLDNQGNRFTGQQRASAEASFFNPLNRGDVVTASLLTSGQKLLSGRVAYATPVSSTGTRFNAGFSGLRYELGDSAAALLAHGDAASGTVSMSHPLRRGTDWNVRAEVQGERLTLRDRVDSTGIRSDRRLDLLSVRLSGDVSGVPGSSAQAAWFLGVTGGRLGFADAASAAADSASGRTAGGFGKVEGQLLVTQPILAGATLAISVRGQQAQGNLDASQKFSLGGPNAVRAYEVGSLSGDSAYLMSVEWRQDLPPLGAAGSLQLVAFADGGRVTINQQPWRVGLNTASLGAAGARLAWSSSPAAWQARLTVAAPWGPAPEISGLKRSTRLWLELIKDF
ncbi:MAG: ShlB/FhaC/HecB family hemolysin secretion/activation protein [Rubrivivax sp.]